MTENQKRRFEDRIPAKPLDWHDAQVEQSSTAGAAKGGNTSDNGSSVLAQAGVRAEPAAKVVETDIDISVIDAVFPIGTKLYLAVPTTPAQVPAADVRAQALEEAAQIALRERDEFRELAARNNGRESDFAFGSVNSAERIAAAIRSLAQSSTADKASEVRAAEWISVEDERKPEERKPVLLFVRTLTRGEDDDGRPYETEGEQVEMSEYRFNNGSPYFQCFVSPMSDNDWVTHWMPLPSAPSTADSGNTSALGEGADRA